MSTNTARLQKNERYWSANCQTIIPVVGTAAPVTVAGEVEKEKGTAIDRYFALDDTAPRSSVTECRRKCKKKEKNCEGKTTI
jgi:hypothetical protein